MKKNKRGFTLIELVAVIAILGILAVVLVPQVKNHIDRSKKTAIQAQCREIVTAVEAYNAEAKPADVITSNGGLVLLASGGAISGDTKVTKTLGDIFAINKIQQFLGVEGDVVSGKNTLEEKFNKIPISTIYETIKVISEGKDFDINKDGTLKDLKKADEKTT